MTEQALLADRMRSFSHQRSRELKESADRLDAAAQGYFGEPQTVDVRKFMGAYARAKRLWSECSGEPLFPEAVIDAGARLIQTFRLLQSDKGTPK